LCCRHIGRRLGAIFCRQDAGRTGRTD
jgi:hypothetical protein